MEHELTAVFSKEIESFLRGVRKKEGGDARALKCVECFTKNPASQTDPLSVLDSVYSAEAQAMVSDHQRLLELQCNS